ncbi:MAG TPA: HAD family hydrolase [Bacillus sp. (in: firmicutes)]|uniref:HAD family hydrolase n=1 Tax=Bacillus litorisediminis TaxID=2922713 RepID=UPI001FAE1298|nr:HAD family hydrolase [Bacillus litorisediminis]HWO75963.1 HAD family hydrolase [Bacillus sp. (in: firmicutes)]
MTYKILFLDIDGTILKPDHTYSESTKDAILQLKKKGIEVFIATGRPLHEINELAHELQIDSFIGYNGAFAVYKNKTILEEPMETSHVKSFLDIAKQNDHEMVLYTSEKNYFTTLDHPLVQNFNKLFDLTQNALFTDTVINEILGITVMNVTVSSQASLYELDENIRLSQVHAEGAEHAYDIIRTNMNKGVAVKRVLEYLHIPKEQSIAFGDGMNDKEMLQSVGEGFAMGNAHPDLFQYAKHITSSVTDSGIFNGLKKLGLVQ